MYYIISISERSTDSRVDVSKYSDLDQAISFAFQLHQVSTCRHFISVRESTGVVVATFVRSETFTAPAPEASQCNSSASDKPKSSFLKRK